MNLLLATESKATSLARTKPEPPGWPTSTPAQTFSSVRSANIIGVDGNGEEDADEGNIIAGNGSAGVQIWGSPQNTVAGNWIGVGLDGAPVPNAGPGIWLAGGSHFNRIGTDGDGESDDLERNVISANSGAGISAPSAWGANNDNVIAGNYIGTDVTGAVAMGNGGSGISLVDSSNTRIGGTTPGSGNVISGNDLYGLKIAGESATGNSVLGNFIGTDVAGTHDLGNQYQGIFVHEGASQTCIGGTTVAAKYHFGK